MGEFFNVSSVEKFQLSDEVYEQRTGAAILSLSKN